MAKFVFTVAQVAAASLAADRIMKDRGLSDSATRTELRRAVLDVAAETREFDPARLAQIVREKLDRERGGYGARRQ